MSRTTLTLVLALVLPTFACDGKPTRSPEEAHDELGDGQLSGQGPGGVGGLLDGKADPKIVEAEALLAEGKHERALALIDEAIAAEPNQARFHYVRGNALSYLDRDQEAEAAYRQAIELDPDDALPHAALGNLLAFGAQATPELQRAAIQQLQAALEREPRLAAAHQSLGVVLLELGEYDKAVEALANADRLAANVETSYALAEAHGKLGNVEQAIAHAKSAVEFVPDASGVDLRLLYARLLMRGDRNDDAAREFERAAKLVPDSPPLRLEVARGLLEMGKADAAMVHMQWLLEVAPHEVPVIVNHGRILVAQGQANEAVKRFDDALKIQADSQAAQTYKIEALVAAKRCKDAKKVFDGLAKQLGWTKGQPLPRALSKAQAYLDAGKCG
jgi:tetratricopeptide (TPR) repeat protein